jgi:hypothetical protein
MKQGVQVWLQVKRTGPVGAFTEKGAGTSSIGGTGTSSIGVAGVSCTVGENSESPEFGSAVSAEAQEGSLGSRSSSSLTIWGLQVGSAGFACMGLDLMPGCPE